MKMYVKMLGLLLMAGSLVGCSASNGPAEPTADAAATPDSSYLLTEKPADAQGVTQVRQESENDEQVVVEGHIGGSADPFVAGVAAFTIVDPSLKWCAEDEGCPTPWDYCCTPDVKENSALVKVVGEDGQPVMRDAKELLGVKELSKIVVRGKAQRDEQGNLTVLADKVHIVSK